MEYLGNDAYDWAKSFTSEKNVNITGEITSIAELLDENFRIIVDSTFTESKYELSIKNNEDGESNLVGTLRLKDDYRILNALVHELYHFYLAAKGLPIFLSDKNELKSNIEIKNKIGNILQHNLMFPLYCNHGLEVNKFITFKFRDYNREKIKEDITDWTLEYFRNSFSRPVSTGENTFLLTKTILAISEICNQWDDFNRRKKTLDNLYVEYTNIKIHNYWGLFLKVLDVFNISHPQSYHFITPEFIPVKKGRIQF